MGDQSIRRARSYPRRFRGVTKSELHTSEMLALLATGAIEIQELVPWSSNYTFLVTLTNATQQALAIYKPSRGERPLWDFPSGTLAKREYASYLVSEALSWPNIPPTLLRDGPQGFGAVQLFVDAVEGEHYFTLRDEHREEMKHIAVFDAIVNNTDRKGGHILIDRAGCIWCIDHGVTFHEHPKLRTVIWDYTQEPVPTGVMNDLRGLKTKLNRPNGLGHALSPLLSNRELDAFCQRIDDLLVDGVFPQPPEDWPHIPWPPI